MVRIVLSMPPARFIAGPRPGKRSMIARSARPGPGSSARSAWSLRIARTSRFADRRPRGAEGWGLDPDLLGGARADSGVTDRAEDQRRRADPPAAVVAA